MDNPPISAENSRRIRTACEECRRRKIKCDGADPCEACEHSRFFCNFRPARRRRALLRANAHEFPQSFKNFQPKVLKEIFQSITLYYPRSSLSTWTTFFGASSNFSFLLNIYRLVVPFTTDSQSIAQKCIEAFGYRRVLHLNLPISSIDSTFSPISGPNLAHLPFTLADLFLDTYISIFLHVMPFHPASSLKKWLRQIYGLFDSRRPNVAHQAMLFAILAIGATFTEHDPWGNRLLEQAQIHINSTAPLISNVMGIQIKVLLVYALYNLQVGKFDAAYELLGDATRKSFTAGLQRLNPSSPDEDIAITTFLTLYSHESYVSMILGRPSSFSVKPINYPSSERHSVLPFLVTFTNIIRALQELQETQDLTLATFLNTTHTIRRRLEKLIRDFQHSTSIHSSDSASKDLQYLLLISNRPFVVLSAIKNRPEYLAEPGENESTAEAWQCDSSWLSEGVAHAISSASMIISLCNDAYKSGSLVKDTSHGSFYIESACLVLIYNSLADPLAILENMISIHQGMDFMRQMACKNLVSSKLSALETILAVTGLSK